MGANARLKLERSQQAQQAQRTQLQGAGPHSQAGAALVRPQQQQRSSFAQLHGQAPQLQTADSTPGALQQQQQSQQQEALLSREVCPPCPDAAPSSEQQRLPRQPQVHQPTLQVQQPPVQPVQQPAPPVHQQQQHPQQKDACVRLHAAGSAPAQLEGSAGQLPPGGGPDHLDLRAVDIAEQARLLAAAKASAALRGLARQRSSGLQPHAQGVKLHNIFTRQLPRQHSAA